jgi:excisionase family DNA binding protein
MTTKELRQREPVTPKLITALELSVLLNVPRNTIYANAKKFGWPCYRVGADIRFDQEEILALIRREAG